MASSRVEVTLTSVMGPTIAKGTAHLLRAKELFTEANAAITSADTDAAIAVLCGCSEAAAPALKSIVGNMVTNIGTAAADVGRIDQAVDPCA